MEKHQHIPAAATWNATFSQWEVGARDTVGNPIGHWDKWHVDGYICGTVDYGNGTPPFVSKRFHPDGTLAGEGRWLGGQRWQGTYRWIKSAHPTNEHFPGGYTQANAGIWSMEFDYSEEGTTCTALRYFDKQNNPVTEKGTPLPQRPATVAEEAYYIESNAAAHTQAYWAAGEWHPWKQIHIGNYTEWDAAGNLLLKCTFDPITGALLEAVTIAALPDQVENDYYSNTNPPVLKRSRHYNYNGRDVRQSYYNEAGEWQHTLRQYQVTRWQKRRYYNNIVVFESIVTCDPDRPPISVRYFYPGGATLLNYTSNGDNTGIWHMYDEAGAVLYTMSRGDEAYDNRNQSWDYFLIRARDSHTTTTIALYLEVIVQKFREHHDEYALLQAIATAPVPDHLQVELDKVNWESIETAFERGKEMPAWINAFLLEDEKVATLAENLIWIDIEHQGSVYEAAYATATVAGRVLPVYMQVTAIRHRLLNFLYDVLTLTYIRQPKKAYREMMMAFDGLVQSLREWCKAKPEDTLKDKTRYIIECIDAVNAKQQKPLKKK